MLSSLEASSREELGRSPLEGPAPPCSQDTVDLIPEVSTYVLVSMYGQWGKSCVLPLLAGNMDV